MDETDFAAARRGRRTLLTIAGALIGIGVVAAAVASDDTGSSRRTATKQVTTPTTARTQVLGVQIDNTTTTIAAPTVTAVAVATTTTSIATATQNGRIYGYSFPSQPNDETTVSLSRDGKVLAERKTDGEGYYEFRDLPAGTYRLFRTSLSSSCQTTTTAGQTPVCTKASSRSDETEVTLAPTGEVRADVF